MERSKSSDRNREVEAKFLVTRQEVYTDLASQNRLSKDYLLHHLAEIAQVDTYFDTPTYNLLRAGYTLRIRRMGQRALITLKSLAANIANGDLDRLEIEAEIQPVGPLPHPAAWPPAIQEKLHPIIPPDATWFPLVKLHQTRLKRTVLLNGVSRPEDTLDLPIAELSLDRVRILDIGENASNSKDPSGEEPDDMIRGEANPHFEEIEVECLSPTSEQHYRKVVSLLKKRKGIQRATASKFERAFEVGLSTEQNITPQMHIAEMCRQNWRKQLMQILRCEHGVRAGIDSEFVHDMRVAIRRARVAYRLFGHFFKRSSIEPYFAMLKTLARKLGQVRDLDVSLENLAEFESGLSPERQTTLPKIRKGWNKHRSAARKKLIKFLDRKKYIRLLTEFLDFCATPGRGVKAKYRKYTPGTLCQVRHVLPVAILTRYARVSSYAQIVLADAPAPIDTLHALRIECKRLRYTLEYVAGLTDRDGKTILNRLKTLQEQLGQLNDIAVEHHRLKPLLDSNDVGAVVHVRLANNEATSLRLRAAFLDQYAQFIGDANRKKLVRAIGRI